MEKKTAAEGLSDDEVFSPEEILESHRFHIWNLHLFHLISQSSIKHGKKYWATCGKNVLVGWECLDTAACAHAKCHIWHEGIVEHDCVSISHTDLSCLPVVLLCGACCGQWRGRLLGRVVRWWWLAHRNTARRLPGNGGSAVFKEMGLDGGGCGGRSGRGDDWHYVVLWYLLVDVLLLFVSWEAGLGDGSHHSTPANSEPWTVPVWLHHAYMCRA